jgi:hypothetical protein
MLATIALGVGESPGAPPADLTRTHSGGGVSVKVTYLNPGDSNGPRFEVVLDTHSVNLDAYDLKQLSTLLDGATKPLQPAKIENKGSGHHREVILSFPRLSSQPKSVEVVIRDVGGVKERIFRWEF